MTGGMPRTWRDVRFISVDSNLPKFAPATAATDLRSGHDRVQKRVTKDSRGWRQVSRCGAICPRYLLRNFCTAKRKAGTQREAVRLLPIIVEDCTA